ncbi:hypothetical protein RYX36_006267 [Vicia faba]
MQVSQIPSSILHVTRLKFPVQTCSRVSNFLRPKSEVTRKFRSARIYVASWSFELTLLQALTIFFNNSSNSKHSHGSPSPRILHVSNIQSSITHEKKEIQRVRLAIHKGSFQQENNKCNKTSTTQYSTIHSNFNNIISKTKDPIYSTIFGTHKFIPRVTKTTIHKLTITSS